MDYIPLMMGFDQTDELFQTNSYPCQLIYPTDHHQQELATHVLLPSPTAVEVNQICTQRQTALGGRKRKAPLCLNELNGDSPHETKSKKMVHREIERQRRQEIATHYASLRSLLPLEYLRGKRSMSDHMFQAVNYIKHLQKNIQELSDKRDELKRNIHPNSFHSNNFARDSTMESLTVRPSSVGIEVIMNTALTGGTPLSKVIATLVEEGVSIVSCISTKVNERVLNIIESEEVSDGRRIQPSELQQKLMNVLIKSQNVNSNGLPLPDM